MLPKPIAEPAAASSPPILDEKPTRFVEVIVLPKFEKQNLLLSLIKRSIIRCYS